MYRFKMEGERWFLEVVADPCLHHLPSIASSGSDAVCQGAKGHDGAHWRYCYDGRLLLKETDVGHGIAVSPAGEKWVTPETKRAELASLVWNRTEVVQPEQVALLDRADSLEAKAKDDSQAATALEMLPGIEAALNVRREVKKQILGR